MSKIAFLGLGAMGSRMAPHLIKAGHDVAVWNRSPAPVAAAVAHGARSPATPREAAEGAEIVFSMLTDDDASKAVWMTADTGALAGLGKDAIAIEASTVSPEWLTSLAAAVETHGATLLDAPVVGSLPQAEAAQLVLLAGGAQETFLKAKPVLGCIASVVHHVGPQCHAALKRGLLHSWCKLASCNGNIRARSKSTSARPYIARLRVFNLLTCPSVCPLLHGSDTAFRTASRSWRIVLAKRCIA
jgi:3-hydroxyisobutyrate dehydrogenase